MKKYLLGIDLGGTFIKGGILNSDGTVVTIKQIPSERELGKEKVSNNIVKLVNELISSTKISLNDCKGLGIGIPGMVDAKTGEVIFANNLNWKNFNIVKYLKEKLDIEIKIGNDANLACLGEYKFGGGKSFENLIFITLGTGVGGGVIIDGKLLEGNMGAGAELGHSVIVCDGRKCTCGRKGCLETYASATALIKSAKEEALKNPESKLNLFEIDGKLPFTLYNEDLSAKKVVDEYINYLACGLINFANIFRPEAILIGGGISNQGDNLIKPLQKILDEEIYAGNAGPKVILKTGCLKNDAGFIGAAALFC